MKHSNKIVMSMAVHRSWLLGYREDLERGSHWRSGSTEYPTECTLWSI